MGNRKTQYTKNVIRESFLALLREKPVEKISVTELCSRADINRSTFYSYYLDVYDLKEQTEQEFFQQISTVFHRTEWEHFMLDMVLALRENAQFCQVLFGEYGDREFLRRCISSWMERLGTFENDENHWRFLFIVNGAAAVTGAWIMSGMREPPEQVARVLERLCESVGAVEL